MIPLVDMHVHLLAGLDDGPPSTEVALAMCRMLVSEGVRYATALAHQNEGYSHNTPPVLLEAAARLIVDLAANGIPLSVFPAAEVMLTRTTFEDWRAGDLLTIGNRGRWLLVEMPHSTCINVLPIAESFRPFGVRLIIAHAERYPELLDDPGLAVKWIEAGCLLQVTANALAEPWDYFTEKALRHWAAGRFIHLLGSDGHGIDRRRPVLAAGYKRLVSWAGHSLAEKIGGEWGQAIINGRAVDVPAPAPPQRSWFSRLFG
jgi:protein-tyrosine phosphatase